MWEFVLIAVCLFTEYCFQSAMLTGVRCEEEDEDGSL